MKWGTSFWTTIHVVALGFPDSVTEHNRSQYKAFYQTLGAVLPCSKCRGNYARHFSELPIDMYLYDKNMLFAWTVRLHNIVNVETGKREWTTEDAKEYYVNGRYVCSVEKKGMSKKRATDILIFLNAVLLVILVVIIIFMQLRKGGF